MSSRNDIIIYEKFMRVSSYRVLSKKGTKKFDFHFCDTRDFLLKCYKSNCYDMLMDLLWNIFKLMSTSDELLKLILIAT